MRTGRFVQDGLVLRPLTPEDWSLFKDLRLEGLKECPGVFLSPYEKEAAYSPSEWQAWLGNPEHGIFGLFDGERIVGVSGVCVREAKDRAVLYASYLKPGYRGRGLSDLFYTARIAWAVARPNLKTLLVSHRKGNEPSRRANQRHGFVFAGTRTLTFGDGTEDTEACYELDLETLRKSP